MEHVYLSLNQNTDNPYGDLTRVCVNLNHKKQLYEPVNLLTLFRVLPNLSQDPHSDRFQIPDPELSVERITITLAKAKEAI